MNTIYKILFATFCISTSYAQNVGINLPPATLPTNTLDVNGTIRIRGGVPGANKVLTSDANGVGAWANPPSAFVLPYVGSAAVGSGGYVLDIANTTGSDGSAIIGRNGTVITGEGVMGVATASAPLSSVAGVYGKSSSTNANGVGVKAFHAGLGSAFFGITSDGIGATISSTNGVAGVFNSTTGFGLQTTGKLRFAGNGVGTLGVNKYLKSIDANGNTEWSDLLPHIFTGANNANILSITNTNTGNSSAIYGATNSTSYGEGVQGVALETSPTSDTYGVYGTNRSNNSYGAAVFGNHLGFGVGVYGDSFGTGVKGEGNYGVHGIGSTYGVFGEKTGTTGSAIHGVGGLRGVYGQSEAYGVYGISNYLNPNQYKYAGVYGESNSTNNLGSGVYGTHSGTGPGVSGYSYLGVGGRFNSDGGGYALVTQDGNVGIGTSTPVAKMDIKGSLYFSHFYYDANEDTYIRGGKAGSRVLINDDLNQGSVGIGISNPNQYLDIKGRMRIYSSAFGTAGLWLNNAANALGNVDGAFIGINCSSTGNETVGFYVGGDWRFDVDRSGNGRFDGTVSSVNGFTCASDFRYKKDILSLENPLGNLLKIKGISYHWKTEDFPEKHFSDKNQIGFIAQDLEKIYPEMVFTDEKGYKSVDYARLTPVLVEAIKEQQIQIDKLQKTAIEMQELKAEMANLKALFGESQKDKIVSLIK